MLNIDVQSNMKWGPVIKRNNYIFSCKIKSLSNACLKFYGIVYWIPIINRITSINLVKENNIIPKNSKLGIKSTSCVSDIAHYDVIIIYNTISSYKTRERHSKKYRVQDASKNNFVLLLIFFISLSCRHTHRFKKR